MERAVVLVNSDEKKQQDAIAEILRQIADKIEFGNLTIKQATGSFVVDFPEDMTLKIRAVKEQRQKVKFSFQLEFFVAYHGQDSITIG
jgi:amphi-Trp domain-containing protein